MKGIKLTVYDWLGYLVPGSLVVWAFVELYIVCGGNLSTSVVLGLPATAQVIFLLVVCYAVGHMLHALANVTIDARTIPGFAPTGYFPDQFNMHFPGSVGKKVHNEIAKYFDADETEPNLICNCYWACYCLVAIANPDSLVHTFLGLTGFYRGMSMACFLVGTIYLIIGILSKICPSHILRMNLSLGWLMIIIVICASLGFLFLRRVGRFRSYLVRTVLAEFLAVSKKQTDKLTNDQNNIDEQT